MGECCLAYSDKLRDFVTLLSSWVLANSASESLTVVCNLLQFMLIRSGFKTEFSLNRIFEDEIEYSTSEKDMVPDEEKTPEKKRRHER